jgi:hypothetical protein
MEHTTVASKIQEIKSVSTNQTEFVFGVLMLLMGQSQALDEIIDNCDDEALIAQTASFRQEISEYFMVLAQEISLIHPNNNELG